MATLLDGKIVSTAVKDRLKALISGIPANGSRPGLAVVLVGEDPGSKIYVANKEKTCQEIGYHSVVKRLPENTSQEELLDWVKRFNSDTALHGLLVQLPLPKSSKRCAQLNGNRLHAQTNPKVGHILLARVTDGVQHPVDAALAESARNKNAVEALELRFVAAIVRP